VVVKEDGPVAKLKGIVVKNPEKVLTETLINHRTRALRISN
jgi:hypothetical protein